MGGWCTIRVLCASIHIVRVRRATEVGIVSWGCGVQQGENMGGPGFHKGEGLCLLGWSERSDGLAHDRATEVRGASLG